MAEVEGQRKELASKLSHLVDSLKTAEARALAAEARIAVLEKVLAEVLDMYFPMSGPTAVKQPPLILEARTTLAAEQKETGK